MDKINNYSIYKQFVNALSPEEKESLGDDGTSCWLYAYFVHKVLNLRIDNTFEPIYDNELNDIRELKLDNDGMYSCTMECDAEMHYFIIFIEGNKLTLLSTYGGQRGIIYMTHDKDFWLNEFKKLVDDNCQEKKNIYKMLFGIKKLYFEDNELVNFKMQYTYTKNVF